MREVSILKELALDERSIKISLLSCSITDSQLRCHLVKSLSKFVLQS